MLPKQTLELNPSHPVIKRLFALKSSDEPLARIVAEQLLDNALVAAGLVDDPRIMLPRLAALLETIVGLGSASAPSTADLEAKRWVSPAERDEREQISLGEELAQVIETTSDKKA